MATKIVHWSIGDAPLKDISLTAVIGNFDGVHFGHQKLISTALELAKNDGTKVGVITFDPHPRRYFRRNEAGFLLSDITGKFLKYRFFTHFEIKIILSTFFNKFIRSLIVLAPFIVVGSL